MLISEEHSEIHLYLQITRKSDFVCNWNFNIKDKESYNVLAVWDRYNKNVSRQRSCMVDEVASYLLPRIISVYHNYDYILTLAYNATNMVRSTLTYT